MSLVRTVRAGEIWKGKRSKERRRFSSSLNIFPSLRLSRELHPSFSLASFRPSPTPSQIKRKTHEVPVRLRVLSPAEVAEGPGSVPKHGELVVLVQQGEERRKSSLLEDVVSALGRVSGDISERPDGLLPDVENGRGEELDEERDGVGVNDDLGVIRGSRSDVGESPGGLELMKRGSGKVERDEVEVSFRCEQVEGRRGRGGGVDEGAKGRREPKEGSSNVPGSWSERSGGTQRTEGRLRTR